MHGTARVQISHKLNIEDMRLTEVQTKEFLWFPEYKVTTETAVKH